MEKYQRCNKALMPTQDGADHAPKSTSIRRGAGDNGFIVTVEVEELEDAIKVLREAAKDERDHNCHCDLFVISHSRKPNTSLE